MKYDWIDEYLMAKKAVTKDLQKEWNWIRYMIEGKMFAAILLTDDDKPYYINLKLDPLEGDMLRQQYEDIIPGYYSNKQHWNSVKTDGEVPDWLLMEMLDKSYNLILKGFGKKKQRELLGLSVCGTDCSACPLYESTCKGCNEACGKVFHMPDGKACLVYACCANKHHFATCADCREVPCRLWREMRDPAYSDEQFEQSITARVKNLKGEQELPVPKKKREKSDAS